MEFSYIDFCGTKNTASLTNNSRQLHLEETELDNLVLSKRLIKERRICCLADVNIQEKYSDFDIRNTDLPIEKKCRYRKCRLPIGQVSQLTNMQSEFSSLSHKARDRFVLARIHSFLEYYKPRYIILIFS